MPRLARLDIPGFLQHVIGQGIIDTHIYRDNKDRQSFVNRLGDIFENTEVKCFAWALLPDHFHLLLRTTTTPLSHHMRRLMTGHAVLFNKRHKRRGHLFQNRYKSIVCEDDPYFLELVRYIHLNPLRAGLVKDLNALDHYLWSGHSVIMGQAENDWQAIDDVLIHFSKEQGKAITGYRQFIERGVEQGIQLQYEGGGDTRNAGVNTNLDVEKKKDRELSDVRILGSEDFITYILNKADKTQENRIRDKMTLNELIRRVAEFKNVNLGTLLSSNREKEVSMTRAIIAFLAVKKVGYSLSDVAYALNISPVSAGQCVKRGEKILENGENLWALLKEMK
ncbi:MAG: transposase [Thermodesulfobacteriota bacterium]|nr:transposase [Thermodesulfobacteriota bacterium]